MAIYWLVFSKYFKAINSTRPRFQLQIENYLGIYYEEWGHVSLLCCKNKYGCRHSDFYYF
jgi:hypothetical protein